jgi:hypothetical protein
MEKPFMMFDRSNWIEAWIVVFAGSREGANG